MTLEIRTLVKNVIQIVIFALLPVAFFYLMEGYEHDAYEEVYKTAQQLNILLFA